MNARTTIATRTNDRSDREPGPEPVFAGFVRGTPVRVSGHPPGRLQSYDRLRDRLVLVNDHGTRHRVPARHARPPRGSIRRHDGPLTASPVPGWGATLWSLAKGVAALLAIHFAVIAVLGAVIVVTNLLFTPVGVTLVVGTVLVAFVGRALRRRPPT